MKEFKTRKLFFSKYPYKILLDFTDDKLNPTDSIRIVRQWASKRFKKDLMSNWKEDWEFRISDTYTKCYVYLEKLSDVEAISKRFEKNITEFHKPSNDKILNLLIDDKDNYKRKLIIQSSLYFGEFRYKFVCKLKNSKDEDAVYEWMTEYGSGAGLQFNTDWVFTPSSQSLYVKDKQQLMVIYLSLREYIKYCEEIMLETEI